VCKIAEWNQIDSKGTRYKTFAHQSKVRIGLISNNWKKHEDFGGQPLCKIVLPHHVSRLKDLYAGGKRLQLINRNCGLKIFVKENLITNNMELNNPRSHGKSFGKTS